MRKILITLLAVPALSFAHNVADNIDILPLDKIGFPTDVASKVKAYNHASKTKGFVEAYNPYVKRLVGFRLNKPNLKNPKTESDKEFKATAKEIPTTFTYKSIIPNAVGYVGIGRFTLDSKWTGIKEFFDGGVMGMCTLSLFSRAGITEHVKLNQDGLRYDVNDKPTRITVEGSYNSGFMYSVRWFDKDFVRDLECANMKIDYDVIKQMIVLAQKIDKA